MVLGCIAGSTLLRKAASLAFAKNKRATLTMDIIKSLGTRCFPILLDISLKEFFFQNSLSFAVWRNCALRNDMPHHDRCTMIFASIGALRSKFSQIMITKEKPGYEDQVGDKSKNRLIKRDVRNNNFVKSSFCGVSS